MRRYLSSCFISNELHEVDEHVYDLDAGEGNDESAESIDEEIALQDLSGAERAKLHAAQGERYQENDDHGVEDHGAEDGALVAETHDVEWGDLWECAE